MVALGDGWRVQRVRFWTTARERWKLPPMSQAVTTHWRRARTRFFASLGAGVLVGVGLPGKLGVALRLVAGWDAGAVALSAIGWWLIVRLSADEARRRAAAYDPGRTAVWALIVVASGISMLATAAVLRRARYLAPDARDLFVMLCVLANFSAWVLTHTGYTLRYAHLYYREDEEGIGGLTFPGDRPPSYFDFAYFSFTIGICFQTSDVAVSSPQIRRAVLSQAVLSFMYNTIILATALNLVLGLFG